MLWTFTGLRKHTTNKAVRLIIIDIVCYLNKSTASFLQPNLLRSCTIGLRSSEKSKRTPVQGRLSVKSGERIKYHGLHLDNIDGRLMRHADYSGDNK